MKKILYILIIFTLLIQPGLGYRRNASAREAGEAPQEPNETTLYVTPNGTGDCTSWTNACELQDALDMALDGDMIWVAEGTYLPTKMQEPPDPRTVTFYLVNVVNVKVYGGFPDTGNPIFTDRDWVNHPSVLSGCGDPGTDSDNSYHVVTVEWPATILMDGFTITAGRADNSAGGGMLMAGGSTLKSHRWLLITVQATAVDFTPNKISR